MRNTITSARNENTTDAKKIYIYNIIGAVFTIVTAILLHFVYDWFGGRLSLIFAAVNESTWEHLKIGFFPMLIYLIFEYFAYGRKQKGFLPIKVTSILIMFIAIVVLFYSYQGVLGFTVFAIDVGIFVIAVLLAYLFSARMLIKSPKLFDSKTAVIISLAVLAVLAVCFFVFSVNAPHIGLFIDPLTGTYGAV